MKKQLLTFLLLQAISELGGFQMDKVVTKQTTHLLTSSNRRTINIMRGIIRGVWILRFEWLTDSLKYKKWLPEESYEMKDLTCAVGICRSERQAFGSHYRMDLFSDIGAFFIQPNCAAMNLKELILLCYGTVTDSIGKAKFFISDTISADVAAHDLFQLSPEWIFDSIYSTRLKKKSRYLLR